jgi:PAS domain S-box-containing protein
MEEDIRVNLLLVDDKPVNLIALEAVLDSLDCNIIEATSGQKALEILETTDVALILLDVQMPILDGFDTARLIKEKFPEKNAPIIFITAVYQEDPYVHKGYQLGAVDYIGKPFDPHVLKAKVGLHVEIYKKTKILQLLEKQLGETASRFRLIFDSLPDAICTTSSDGKVTFLNKAMEKYTGYQPGESLGKDLFALFKPNGFPDFTKGFKETLLMEHSNHVFKTKIVTKSGKPRPVEVYLNTIMQDSKFEGAVCVVHDLSKAA